MQRRKPESGPTEVSGALAADGRGADGRGADAWQPDGGNEDPAPASRQPRTECGGWKGFWAIELTHANVTFAALL